MVAKRVQHVGFNNVGWCCTNMLDPFSQALTTRNVVVDESKEKKKQPQQLIVLPNSNPLEKYMLEKKIVPEVSTTALRAPFFSYLDRPWPLALGR